MRGSTEAAIPSAVYRCPECAKPFEKWSTCLEHLKATGHANPGNKVGLQPASFTRPLLNYRCPECDEPFQKWSTCLQHLKATGHANPLNKQGLQQRCMSGSTPAPAWGVEGEEDDWIHSHMPEWLLQALYSWPSGWGEDQDAAYQQDLKIRKTMKEALKKMPVSGENYESAMLNEAERNGFHAASVVMISRDRVLMLFEREENDRIYLGLPGGQRTCITEDAWSCARREALEETGGQAKLSTTPPASVAWQATTKQAVFIYDTSDELVAEDIQGLCRPPEGEQGMLPPSGPLTAVWVPLTLLRTTNFQQQYLHPHESGPLIQAAFRLIDFRGRDRRHETDTGSHRLFSAAEVGPDFQSVDVKDDVGMTATSPTAADNASSSQQTHTNTQQSWKNAAIALWRERVLTKKKIGWGSIIGEVKSRSYVKKLPPGVTAQRYCQVVTEALKNDSALTFNKAEGVFTHTCHSECSACATLAPGRWCGPRKVCTFSVSEPKYRCPECAELFEKWSNCKEHLKATGHAKPFAKWSKCKEHLIATGLPCETMAELKNWVRSHDAGSGLMELGLEEERARDTSAPAPTACPEIGGKSASTGNRLCALSSSVIEVTSLSSTYAELIAVGNEVEVHESSEVESVENTDEEWGTSAEKTRRHEDTGVFEDEWPRDSPPAPACNAAPPFTVAGETPLSAYLSGASRTSGAGAFDFGISVADGEGSVRFHEATLLGHSEALRGASGGRAIYLNTHEPFCFVSVGIQGAGKSHTLACVLEGCLVPFKHQSTVRLTAPMTTLVLHFDVSATSVCEATGLISPAPELRRLLHSMAAATPAPCVPSERAVVLVSPSYLKQRRAFYGSYCSVRPLLFRWHTLTADHIKRIMRIKDGDNQLYVASLLDLLRRYQRIGVVPKFQEFVLEVRKVCKVQGQEGPLGQRLALLESLVAESALNSSLADEGGDLGIFCKAGHLVVVDMTDPLLSSEEANGVFQVLVEQYRALPGRGGKVLALDEAHKYMKGETSDGLCAALVNTARLMRHDGMRLLVSTQSPLALAPELLELVSVAFLHRFHSSDWFAYLSKKLPLSPGAWRTIVELSPGHAVLFAARHNLPATWSLKCGEAAGWEQRPIYRDDPAPPDSAPLFKIAVRQRITADRGASRTNAAPPRQVSGQSNPTFRQQVDLFSTTVEGTRDGGVRERPNVCFPAGSGEGDGRGEAAGVVGEGVEGGGYRVLALDVEYEWVDSAAGMKGLLDHLHHHLQQVQHQQRLQPRSRDRHLAESTLVSSERETIETDTERQAGYAGNSKEMSGERECTEKGAGRGGGEVVFVGIDCEWNMHREREYSKINRRLTPSIIQISILGRVFVVDCNAALYFLQHAASPTTAAAKAASAAAGSSCEAALYAQKVSECVLLIFSHEAIRVVGFALQTDLDKLTALVPELASLHLPPSKIVDLQLIALRAFGTLRKTEVPSLKRVCERFLSTTLDKSQQCSKWDRRPLSHAQLEYAALDARVLDAHLLPVLFHLL